MVSIVHTEPDVHACIQAKPVAAGHSISPSSAWPIHGHKDKTKSFESNLQDNRLLLRPEVNQCCAEVGRPKERHFPSSSARDEATFNLTSFIIKTSTRQSRGLQSLSLWYYCQSALHPFSLLHTASLCHTAKIDGNSMKEGHPLPHVSSLSYTGREEKTQRGVHWGSRTQWGISQSSKEGQEGCWSKKMQVKSVRHKTQHGIHAHRHLHNAREEREVYFIVPATVPMLWKCMIKKVNCRFCVTRGGALLSFLTFT